jgi:hypothetical protein
MRYDRPVGRPVAADYSDRKARKPWQASRATPELEKTLLMIKPARGAAG